MFDPFASHDFNNDGCSFWFNQWRNVDMRPCCAIHDVAFGAANDLAGRIAANDGLFSCAVHAGAWDWGVLAFIGTGAFALYRTWILAQERKATET